MSQITTTTSTGPTEPTVGSREGRAMIDAEARLRGWDEMTSYVDAPDWWAPGAPHGVRAVSWYPDRLEIVGHRSREVFRIDAPVTDVLAAIDRLHPLPAEPVSDPAPTPSTAAPIEGSVAAVEGPSGWVLGEWTEDTIDGCRRWRHSLWGEHRWAAIASTTGSDAGVFGLPTDDGSQGPCLLSGRAATRDECDAVLREHGYLPPAKPTVGSPEGRAIIAAEARLRGWHHPPTSTVDWYTGPSRTVEWYPDRVEIYRVDAPPPRAASFGLDRPASEAIAAIRRFYPLPSADTREGWTIDDLRADLDAAQTSIREATHTLATALDHDTEAALVLETAAEEVVRRWRRDREQLADAHAALGARGATDDRRLLVLAAALIAVAPDVAARLGVSLG